MSPKMKSIFSKKYITGLILFTTLVIGNGGAENVKFPIVSKDMKPHTQVTDKVVIFSSFLCSE